ncbi:hypothetical protein [Loigolactobacillus rennini]|uniref:Uncharacterized protein n=2 Tax=Loigolactobacillus rennini TaxID=238013 RepID=A0A0R2D3D0_9LACO|nr:hypothetical protein [Loigolactobacillus rennini]KRM98391.1 hypothetical protein FC24_GL001342 [Loigolactobacillus rennini DSM 20253]SFZ88035.1 FIG00743269: hypothetical protein [Loigolactobacillus rennini]
MAEEVTEAKVLNETMSEAFDWSDSKTVVRDAIWDYFMEKNDHNTEKTIADVKPYTGGEKSEDDIKDFVEKNLKK